MIDFMVGGVEIVFDVVLEFGIEFVVFFLSMGLMNLFDGDFEIKNEVDYWFDFEVQKVVGKFFFVVKMLMDQYVFQCMQSFGDCLRVSILNLLMIIGLFFLLWFLGNLCFVQVVFLGKCMQDGVFNGLMLFIDVCDFVVLMIVVVDNLEVLGCYFGVKKSWYWDDVLGILEEVCCVWGIVYRVLMFRFVLECV